MNSLVIKGVGFFLVLIAGAVVGLFFLSVVFSIIGYIWGCIRLILSKFLPGANLVGKDRDLYDRRYMKDSSLIEDESSHDYREIYTRRDEILKRRSNGGGWL